jgi:hypothetical protein
MALWIGKENVTVNQFNWLPRGYWFAPIKREVRKACVEGNIVTEENTDKQATFVCGSVFHKYFPNIKLDYGEVRKIKSITIELEEK